LVGSSRISMSGFDSSSRHSATRRFSPPDRFSTAASQGGRRSASAATSSLRSRSQAPAASIFSCSSACSASRSFISSSDMGSANFMLTSLNWFSSDLVSATPSSTLARTSRLLSSSGSCAR
jgi:hypothetical protein